MRLLIFARGVNHVIAKAMDEVVRNLVQLEKGIRVSVILHVRMGLRGYAKRTSSSSLLVRFLARLAGLRISLILLSSLCRLSN